MNKSKTFVLQIKSIKSLTKGSDFLTAVKLHCDMLPEYMPMKWGWYEPLKAIFDPNHLESLLYIDGSADSVWWKRIGKQRATGSFMRRWNTMPHPDTTHATIKLNVHETTHQQKILSYLKVASQINEGDIGLIDSIAEQYKELGYINDYATYGSLLITTHTLRHWLPEMPWAVVFGPAYIRMFGKERLLTCPAYKVEDIGEEMVFIQLTPNMEDIHTKYDEVMQARALAKRHLGNECFFKAELAYDYRLLEPEEIAQKAGKVFRVPEFILKAD